MSGKNQPSLASFSLHGFGRAMIAAADAGSEALAISDPVEAVHELRKSFKQMRGLLRLVGGREGGEARQLRRALGEAARTVGAARDQAAQREALEDLVEKADLDPVLGEIARAALDELGSGEAPRDGTGASGAFPPNRRARLEALIAACHEAIPRLAANVEGEALLDAILEDYVKARRIGRMVGADDAEELHELRKAVISHRYQMELLTHLWPAAGEVWESELQRLREKLGKHHDLAVLRDRLDTLPPEAEESEWFGPLTKAARSRQARLSDSALRLHARLFAEKPEAFRRRFASYMKAMSDRK